MNPSTTKPNISPTDYERVQRITTKLALLGHEMSFVMPISIGPLVTTYRFMPRSASKVKSVEALADDIALELGVETCMIKRMPGESSIGITVPNIERTLVQWKDIVQHSMATQTLARLPLSFGVDSLGKPYVEDLVSLPHLLIAGSTGGGKSTLLHSIIATLAYVRNSQELKFVLSDTKQVEFGNFVGLPHLLFEPATTVYQTLEQLDWVNTAVDERLKICSQTGTHNIVEHNALDKSVRGAMLPYIVVVIDELADLMASDKKGESKLAEAKISRIVQRARAAGVHLIAATQRPSVDVIKGSIKSNFNARLSFRLPSGTDSRTVLSTEGAEHLLARGDMLFASPNKPGLTRLHSAYATADDIKGCVEAVKVREQYAAR